MKLRLGLFFVILFAAELSALTPAQQQQALAKMSPWLEKKSEDGKRIPFFAVMRDRADVSFAYQLPTKQMKGIFVFNVLTETAKRTQAGLQRFLKARGIPFQSFWIVNEILIQSGDRGLMMDIAARSDVDRLEGNPVVHNPLPRPEPNLNVPGLALSVEWNVTKVNSPSVWALGFNGQNIVVGGQDTGYRWTHNALKPHYRGWNGTTANHDYNWHDSIHSSVGNPCGNNATAPCDDDGHGTHTMGSAVGYDGGSNQIGNAPGAKWIGCRNMDQGNGQPSTYLECFQWFLAPTTIAGTNPDPTKAPDITTNSWACPASEGCSWDSLQTAVDNQKAAGIMTIVAAGNDGSACNTIGEWPTVTNGGPPANYASAFTCGSTTNSANNVLSSFSSRGYAYEGGNPALMKPNIMGPGSSVRSSYKTSDNTYATLSGTSMATPNVAGAVATVLSGHVCYVGKQDNIALLMTATATRIPTTVEACGGDYVNGPNNSWGYGLTNALKAFQSAAPPVADGWSGHAGGTAAKFVKSSGNIAATWDVSTCNGVGAMILYGNIGDYSGYAGSADCSAGANGSKTFSPPSGSVWFNIVWANIPNVVTPQGIAGHPGFSSAGARTWTSTGLCNIVCDDSNDNTCN